MINLIINKNAKIVFLLLITLSIGLPALSKIEIRPQTVIDLTGLLWHGESSYENYNEHSLEPYNPNYFIIELFYSPSEINLQIRYYCFYCKTLHAIDLYTDGAGSGEYYLGLDHAATYIDIHYYDSQPDYGDVDYWSKCYLAIPES